MSVLVILLFFLSVFPFSYSALASSSSTSSPSTSSDHLKLDFSTFLGGTTDFGYSIVVDSQANIYVTGWTSSSNLPATNAFQSAYGGGSRDAFVAKFDSSGNLIFSTFLGGSNYDEGHSIAVDSQINCYVTGYTMSSNFPTKNAFQSALGGVQNVFVAKFNSTGSLVFSTFLGGSYNDEGYGIAVDSQGNSYITGYTSSSNFPIKNAYNSTYGGSPGFDDAFVAKFNSTGSVVFSTFLGGSSGDTGYSIAVDNQSNSYVTGSTTSPNFPIKNAYKSTYDGGNQGDIFISKFDSTGNLVFSTFLGSDDVGSGIAVDKEGNSYITGYTSSKIFPTKNAYNSTYSGNQDAFVAKFDSSGNLVFSTYLGGNSQDEGHSIALDNLDNIYVTGTTFSSNFPTKNAYQSAYSGNGDAFVTKFDSSGNLVMSTYLGGNNYDYSLSIAVDRSQNFFITGGTYSENFPTKNAFDFTYSQVGSPGPLWADIFITKFNKNGDLVFSTYLGGKSDDFGSSITVDSFGNCYVTGTTSSSDFPLKNAYNITLSGLYDTFLAEFDSSGTLVFSSYFSGNGTGTGGVSPGPAIILDHKNNIYITGSNFSSAFVIEVSAMNPISSNGSFNIPFISPILNFLGIHSSIFLYILFIVLGITSILGLVEYRQYLRFKHSQPSRKYFSFKTFLLSKFTRHSKNVKSVNHISDKIFNLLDEIENENSPKD